MEEEDFESGVDENLEFLTKEKKEEEKRNIGCNLAMGTKKGSKSRW